MTKMRFWFTALFLACSGLFITAGIVCAQGDAEQTTTDSQLDQLTNKLWEDSSFLFKTVLYGTLLEPSDSTQNPNNDFLEIPKYSATLELRPDMTINLDPLTLVAKPRFSLQAQQWADGSRDGETETKKDLYLNEGLANLRLVDELFVSYGRENLQWGPSFLLSPSNPFFRDNGRANPKKEVPGMEFARLVWVPASSWTVSLIANTGEGRQQFIAQEFQKAYAVKLDYTGYQRYASLIGSHREDEVNAVGAFAGWTASDALLVYGEGSVTEGSAALYPLEMTATPSGFPLPRPVVLLRPTKEHEESLEPLALLGAAYTLEAGPTLTAEYVYNSAGYDDQEAELYLNAREMAAYGFSSFTGPFTDPIHSLSERGLSKTLDTGLRLLRKNYIMLQYQDQQILGDINVILRYTYNLDDDSSIASPIIEYEFQDHTQFFLVGSKSFGSDNTEFRSLVDYSLMFGLEYIF